jgi:hypothetical protein
LFGRIIFSGGVHPRILDNGYGGSNLDISGRLGVERVVDSRSHWLIN